MSTPLTTVPSPLRIAIVGYGNAGSKYAGLLERGAISGAVLSAIVSRSAKQAAPSATPRFSNLAALVAAQAADAVIITTPHPSHPALAEEAASAGLHVLVEKPLTVTIDEARRLAALPAPPRQVRAVMLDRRTNPLWRHVRAEARSAAFGPLRADSAGRPPAGCAPTPIIAAPPGVARGRVKAAAF
ncbi:gfo/Idh/MocA family oxidoreductase [Opitutaceae bacterium TAV3]|nr:gfo/Idh/MocA family oxidoreductase [Opitutaceae bacterium TAV3]